MKKANGSEYPQTEENREKWYFNPAVVFGAILFFGPLALLLLWARPKTKLLTKILVSIVVLILTGLMTFEAVNIYREIIVHFENLAEIYAPVQQTSKLTT